MCTGNETSACKFTSYDACVVAVISARWIATAPICNLDISRDYHVRLGTHDITNGTESSVQIRRFVCKRSCYFGILYKFNKYVQPFCLPATDQQFSGSDTDVVVVGWNYYTHTTLPIPALQQIRATAIREDFERDYLVNSTYPNAAVPGSMLLRKNGHRWFLYGSVEVDWHPVIQTAFAPRLLNACSCIAKTTSRQVFCIKSL